jgi:2-oxoisovalerate dehydrogenase E2 component (dihydrolipoyl transacylase)
MMPILRLGHAALTSRSVWCRALVAGCRAEEPGLNAWFESRSLGLRVLKKIDIGIAVDLPDGLFVPVLRDAATRDAADLRRGLGFCSRSAR